ncbi:hypothetical protein B0T24DRAFT_387766 [Lasiosphaeria ovina]|uniref:Uncharacterized protein n=1 Tax=Lasiosphaeria ovina TaxID=92902 RepID=A0AAE0JZM5_9PEZI|nr:hypothetical protein B0T24DRAFT_387766 [Lasiosphaeria ovina]
MLDLWFILYELGLSVNPLFTLILFGIYVWAVWLQWLLRALRVDSEPRDKPRERNKNPGPKAPKKRGRDPEPLSTPRAETAPLHADNEGPETDEERQATAASEAEIDGLAAAWDVSSDTSVTTVAAAQEQQKQQTRERIAHLIQRHGHDINTWCGELAHRNVGGSTTTDHVNFITDLVERYALWRPWIMTARAVRQMRVFRDASAPRGENEGGGGDVGPWVLGSHGDNSSLIEDLKLRYNHHRVYCRWDPAAPDNSDATATNWVTDSSAFLPDDRAGDGLDILLGVAGYFPFGDRVRQPEENGLRAQHSEWRRHITVDESHVGTGSAKTRSVIKVSYGMPVLPPENLDGRPLVTSERDMVTDSLSHVLDNMWYAFRSLVAVLQRIEHRVRLGHGLVYLRSTGGKGRAGILDVKCSLVPIAAVRGMVGQLQRLPELRDRLLWEKSRGQSDTIFGILEGVIPFVDQVLGPLGIWPYLALGKAERIHHLTLTVQLLSMAVHLELAGPANEVEFDRFLDHAMSRVQLKGMGLETGENFFIVPVKFPFLGGAEAFVFSVENPAFGEDGLIQAASLTITPSQILRIFRPDALAVSVTTSRAGQVAGCFKIASMSLFDGVAGRDPTSQSPRPTGIPKWTWTADEKLGERAFCATGLNVTVAFGSAASTNTESNVTDTDANDHSYNPNDASSSTLIGGASTTQPVLSARCELEQVEEKVRARLQHHLTALGTRPASWSVKCLRVGGALGMQAGASAAWTFERVPARTEKAQLVHAAQSLAFESRVLHLDCFCAVLVSLHGGVMQRVRLRDLIAAVAPAWIASDVPLPLGRAHQDSVARLVAVLKGDTPAQDVLGELMAGCEDEDGSKEHEFREAILRLIHGAMRMLEHTGYVGGGLVAAWLGGPEGHQQLNIDKGSEPWVRALADTELTTSFVCVINSCLETPECPCPGKEAWRPPSAFRLRTRVAYYRQRIDRDGRIGDEGGGAADLKVGKAYPVNSLSLGMFADVVGFETVKETGEKQYQLAVKKSKVGRLLKYIIDDRGTLRESPDGQLCVMSSKKAFKT